MYDYIIAGAGFAGSILAEQIASQLDKKVLIIEKRNHIGGNCYDSYDKNGVLVHHYGPHILHTNSEEVWNYLSEFTEWNLYMHEVLGNIDGKEVPIPFNLTTLHSVFPKSIANSLEEKLTSQFGYNVKVPILKLRETKDEDLEFLAEYIYEKVFLNYTLKQWGLTPEEIDPAVTARVPVYISRDDRYFQDKYQGLPKYGYTNLFKNILNHPNINLMLNTNVKDFIKLENGQIYFMGEKFNGQFIYTGGLDELFDYQYGDLPYRSLRFEFINYRSDYYQEVGTINYPNNYNFTRITEFKHMTGQDNIDSTTIIEEYPQEHDRNDPLKKVPYYPIFNDSGKEKHNEYKGLANKYNNLIVVGRLAEYKYYNMDAIVYTALDVFNRKVNK